MANKEQLSTSVAVQEAPSTNAEPTQSGIDATLVQAELTTWGAAQDDDKNKVSDQASAVVEAPPEARGSWQARLARLDEAGVIDAVRSDKNDKLYAFSGEKKRDEKGRRRGTSFVGNKELSAIEDYSDVIQQHLGERAAQVEAEKLRVRNESLEQTVVDQEARIKDLEAQLSAKNAEPNTLEMAIVPVNVVDSFLESQKDPKNSELAIVEAENPMVAIERRGGLFSKLKETVSAAQDQIRNAYYRVGTMFGYYRDKLASGQAFENVEALKGEKSKLKRRIIGGVAVAAISIGGAIAIRKGMQGAFEGVDFDAWLGDLFDAQEAHANELSGGGDVLDLPVEGDISPDGHEHFSVGGYGVEHDPFFDDGKEGQYSFGVEIIGDTTDAKFDELLDRFSNSQVSSAEYMYLTEWDELPDSVNINGVELKLDSQPNIQEYLESLDSDKYDEVVNNFCNYLQDNANVEEIDVNNIYEGGYQWQDTDGNLHYEHQEYININDPDDTALRMTYREDIYDGQGNIIHHAGDNILDTNAFVAEFGTDVDANDAGARLQCGGQAYAPKDEPPADSAIPPGNEEPPVPNPEPEPKPTPDPKETSPIQDEFTDKDPNETAVNNEPGNVNNPGGLTPELTGPGITNNPQPPIVAPPPAPPTETVTIPVNSGNVTAEVGPSNITPDNTYQSTTVTGGVPSYEEMRNTAVNTATDASGNVVNTGQQINVGGIRR